VSTPPLFRAWADTRTAGEPASAVKRASAASASASDAMTEQRIGGLKNAFALVREAS
jgi:hypothetical protein